MGLAMVNSENSVTMIAVILLIMVLAETVVCEQSTSHGLCSGVEHKVECPYQGAITGINTAFAYHVSPDDDFPPPKTRRFLRSISFICNSSVGTTTLGPYGYELESDSYYTESCPEGQYVNSFVGREKSDVFGGLHIIGIRCRNQLEMNDYGQLMETDDESNEHGWFDDVPYSVGARPVSVSVYADTRSAFGISCIRTTYDSKTYINRHCSGCNQYEEEWAPLRGTNSGLMYSIVCPNEGVITGFQQFLDRSDASIQSVAILCSSSLGETKFGPYPNSRDVTNMKKTEHKCPPGTFIGSIRGIKQIYSVDMYYLSFRCVSYDSNEEMYRISTTLPVVREMFDDERYTARDKRPVEIKVYASTSLNGIKIKYGNLPIAHSCKVREIEVMDAIIAQYDGIEIIGVNTASDCSPWLQQLSLQITKTVEESVGVEVMEGSEHEFEGSVSLTGTTAAGVIFASVETSLQTSFSYAYTKTFSTTKTKQTTTGTQNAQGIITNYQGPGAATSIGYLDRYKIDRDNVRVRYHFTCNDNSFVSKPGKIKLRSKQFGMTHFQSFHFQFDNSEKCTDDVRLCLSRIRVDNILDPTSLRRKFNMCFPPNSGTSYRK